MHLGAGLEAVTGLGTPVARTAASTRTSDLGEPSASSPTCLWFGEISRQYRQDIDNQEDQSTEHTLAETKYVSAPVAGQECGALWSEYWDQRYFRTSVGYCHPLGGSDYVGTGYMKQAWEASPEEATGTGFFAFGNPVTGAGGYYFRYNTYETQDYCGNTEPVKPDETAGLSGALYEGLS